MALAVDAEGQSSSSVPASLYAGHPGSKRDFVSARWKVRLTLKSNSLLAYTSSPLSPPRPQVNELIHFNERLVEGDVAVAVPAIWSGSMPRSAPRG